METAGQLGKYRLGAQLAIGGMGEVFLARQEGPAGFAKNVVIKRILKAYAQEPAFIEMFLNEARLAAALEHPNVVQIFELGEADGTWFIAMEYIHGCSLRRIRQRLVDLECPFPPAIAARLCSQALQGLHYAHTLRDDEGAPLDIVHRDVSPDNLLVGFNGVTKVVDFGIAKAAGSVSTTRAGAVKGKFAYMPPEQILSGQIDARSDVYAMGVVLYELLTGGVRPFQSPSEPGLMRAILQEAPPPLRAYSPHVPPQLESVVMRAIARDPADRFQSAEDMSVALEAYIHAIGQTLTGAHIGTMLKELFPEEAANRLPTTVGARTPSGARGAGTGAGSVNGSVVGTAGGTGTGAGTGTSTNARTPTPSAARWSASARQEQAALTNRGILPINTPPPSLAVGTREADLPSAVVLDIEVDDSASGAAAASAGKRRRMVALAGAAVVLLLVGGAAVWMSGGSGSDEAPAGSKTAQVEQADQAQQAAPQKAPAPAPVAENPVAAQAVAGPSDVPPSAATPTAVATPEAPAPVPQVVPAAAQTRVEPAEPRERVRSRARPGRPAPVVQPAVAAPAAAPANGRMLLRVNPWAEVFVGGRSLGITPIDPVVLPAGSHTIVLKNPQLGLEKRVEARVPAGGDVLVKADLLE